MDMITQAKAGFKSSFAHKSTINSNDISQCTNTKDPVYSKKEQDILLDKIEEMQADKKLDPMYSIFWRLSISTGWRTNDVCEIEFKSINFDTGKASITINKQTNAERTRAAGKVLRAYKEELKAKASNSGDYNLYMKIDQTNYKNIGDVISKLEQERLLALCLDAMSKAKLKTDTKTIPPLLLALLKQRKELNHFDDFVFSKRLMKNNRAKNMEGCITRQSVHRAFKKVFTWFSENVNSELKLSIYSSRKVFGYNLFRGVNGDNPDITRVLEQFNHSSIQMSRKYLGLKRESDIEQAEIAKLSELRRPMLSDSHVQAIKHISH